MLRPGDGCPRAPRTPLPAEVTVGRGSTPRLEEWRGQWETSAIKGHVGLWAWWEALLPAQDQEPLVSQDTAVLAQRQPQRVSQGLGQTFGERAWRPANGRRVSRDRRPSGHHGWEARVPRPASARHAWLGQPLHPG